MFLGGNFLFSSPELVMAGEICKKTHSIWSIWAPRAPFVIFPPPIWGHHPVLDFHTQITRKSSTAMCYNGPGRNYGETAVFTFGLKVIFWPWIRFFQRKKRNLLKYWYLFRQRVLFCLRNFSWSWLDCQDVNAFFGPKTLFSAWDRHGICQKFYTVVFSGKKIYAFNFT